MLLAGVLALWISSSQDGAPYISNDGYQYLDAASNLSSGQCFCANIVVFDEQVAFGHFPVPFTHFAPGYPLLIAAISRTGMAAATAGYLLSAFGFLAALWLIQDIALGLGARAWVTALFSLMWITHATALFYASMVGTESLFTALLLALVALIVREGCLQGSSAALLIGIGVVAGFSYWIRYPGLFLVGGAGVYLVARAWRVPRARPGALAGLLSAAVLVGSVQLRNAFYTGSWRGAFNDNWQAPRTVIIETLRSFPHLMTGDRVPLHFSIWIVVFLVSAGVLSFIAVRTLIALHSAKGELGPRFKGDFEPFAWTLFIGFVYISGVMVATLTTIAGDWPRYYFPVYPLFPACAAAACSVVARGTKSLLVILLVLSAITIQARNLFVRPPQPDWVFTQAMLAEEVEPGTPLLQWLRKQVSPDEAIVAIEGQAVHYVLQRPVVAVIPADKTSRPADEEGFRSLMKRFGSRYLLVFPNAPPDRIPEQNSYDFLQSLAAGKAPAWLKPAVRTRDAAVYECGDCGT